MAQISSIRPLPDPISNLAPSTVKSGSPNTAQKAAPAPAPTTTQTDETQASPLQAQLTRLSFVLNGQQTNATATRAQYVQAYNQVKSGSYNINPLDVSRSIVQDLLTQQ